MGRGSKRGQVRQQSGILPFVLEEVADASPITSQAGLMTIAELALGMKLPEAAGRAVSVMQRDRGCSAWEFIESLVLMIAGGGDCVDDLSKLSSDPALTHLLGHEIPSPSATKKFLYGFHDDRLNTDHSRQRELMPSFVPPENAPLQGLDRLNDHVVAQVDRVRPKRVATLDHDGTIIESTKRVASRTYEGSKGYQPSLVLWAERDLIVADEFRDGNQ